MQERYEMAEVEAAAQLHWEQNSSFKVTEDPQREKYYCLYVSLPGGKLHIGHVRNYTIGDVIARYQRMLGKTCCNLWAGTRLDCRRKGLRSRTGWRRQNGPTAISII